MIRVVLDPSEMLQGAMVGVMRQIKDVKAGCKPAHGAGYEKAWQYNIEGALGEMALAKYLSKYWGGTGIMGGCDVGDCDVRTRSQSHYDLILHDSDPDDRIFWLLTGRDGIYDVHGWIRAVDGKLEEYMKDPAGGRPAYFVPQSALNSPEEWE